VEASKPNGFITGITTKITDSTAMKNKASISLLFFLFVANLLMAQGGSGQSGSWFIYLILAIVILLFFLVVI
jgi:hypothetical protein